MALHFPNTYLCLYIYGYPLGLVGNYVKPKDNRSPLPLTPFPQPLQPYPLIYESLPPGIKDLIGSLFFQTSGCYFGHTNS